MEMAGTRDINGTHIIVKVWTGASETQAPNKNIISHSRNFRWARAEFIQLE